MECSSNEVKDLFTSANLTFGTDESRSGSETGDAVQERKAMQASLLAVQLAGVSFCWPFAGSGLPINGDSQRKDNVL